MSERLDSLKTIELIGSLIFDRLEKTIYLKPSDDDNKQKSIVE